MPVLIIAAVLLLIILFTAYITWRIAFYNPLAREETPYELPKGEQYEQGREGMLALIAEMDALPFERVSITARDGMQLSGRYYHVADGAPVQIQMHGYRGSAIRDFCGGNKLAREAGQNTLVIDQRAHGKSGGSTISFGVKERYDCLDWIDYVIRRFGPDTEIYLSGVSMGAATVLMAAGLDLPANVLGVVADSPYSAPETIIRKVCRDMKLPPALVWPFLRLGARLFGGFDPCAASAVEALRHARVPVLIIHGEDDRFVPCEMSRELAAACASEIRLETFPGAGHGLSFIVDFDRYKRTTNAFFDFCHSRRAG